jgi:cobalt-zinc-cadmium efflux system outer membrane protein
MDVSQRNSTLLAAIRSGRWPLLLAATLLAGCQWPGGKLITRTEKEWSGPPIGRSLANSHAPPKAQESRADRVTAAVGAESDDPDSDRLRGAAQTVAWQEEPTPAESPVVPPAPEGDEEQSESMRPEADDDATMDENARLEEPQLFELTLNQVVFASINGHPTIAAAMEAICQAQGDYLTSTLTPNPSLFTDGQLLPLTRPFTATRQGGPPQQDVILTYPIDWFLFGKRLANMTSAQYGVYISQSDFQDLVRRRIFLAANAYYNALEAQALREITRQNVESLQQLERITQLAVENGGRPAVELNRIQLDLLAAQQAQRASRGIAISAAAQLRAVVANSNLAIRTAAKGDLTMPLDGSALPLNEAVVIAERERPDINSLRWQVVKAGSNIDVQELAAKPQIAPSVGYTRQYQEKAIGFPDANSFSVGLTATLPIFDRNQGNIYKAMSQQRQAQYQLSSAMLELRAEVEQAVAELRVAEENAKSVAEEQLGLAQKVRDSITAAYQEGGRPLIDVLDAQRNFRETNRLFFATRAAYWRALYRYYAAIGRQASTNE